MEWKQKDLDVFNESFNNAPSRAVMLRSVARAYAVLALPVELLEQLFSAATSGAQCVTFSDPEDIEKAKAEIAANGTYSSETVDRATKLFENDLLVLQEIIRLKHEGKLPTL